MYFVTHLHRQLLRLEFVLCISLCISIYIFNKITGIFDVYASRETDYTIDKHKRHRAVTRYGVSAFFQPPPCEVI